MATKPAKSPGPARPASDAERVRPRPRPRVPRGNRPTYLDAGHGDALLSMILVLATELSASQDRVETLEQLVAERLGLSPGEIERAGRAAVSSPARAARRTRLVKRLLRVLLEDAGPLSREERARRYEAFVASLGEG